MPELPEVEHLRRTLGPLIRGRAVTRVRLLRPDIFTGARTDGTMLMGAVLRTPRRRGKQLALLARDGRVLCVQLGMTGQLFVVPPGGAARADHVHARWTLNDGATLVFRDPRRFGRLTPFTDTADLRRRAWDALGPDALTAPLDALTRALTMTCRPVKAALLDQSLLAGVGNIYADESLFRARINPTTPAHHLVRPETIRLARSIRRVLTAAIGHGGSTLRDYVDGQGIPGRHQQAHLVYGRAGLPCTHCGRSLSMTRIQQRSTVFCAICQPQVRPYPRDLST